MNKQEFISSAVSHYLKGYNCIIFVDKNYKPYLVNLCKYTDFERLNEFYRIFKNEIEDDRLKFDTLPPVREN